MSQQQLKSIVLRRLQANENQIKHSLACIAHGNPLASEPSEQRLQKRIIRKTNLTPAEARQVTQDIKAKAEAAPPLPAVAALPRRPEAIWGDTIDFVGVAFLERGVAAARTVARVAFHSGQGQGTGFLISNRLFLTNNHVIQTAAQVAQFRVEFDYERDLAGQQRTVSSFSLDPQAFFLTDSIDGLDFTIVAIGNQISGPAKIETFGWSGLSSAPDKHALGEAANIVQHPDGRFKEVVLRENRLVSRLDMALHYVADTEPGSSGSPVFNNDWEVIALHHWGGPWRELPTGDDEHSYEINEGIRISAIVKHLKQIYPSLTADRQVLLSVVLEREDRGPVVATSVTPEQPIDTGARLDGDGRVTWRVPLEVSVRLPMLNARPPLPPPPALPIADDIASSIIGPSDGEATRPSTNYSRRSGFVTDFISGLTVPLPKLSQAQRQIAAQNQEAEDGDDPFELKYHHFSIVMNARRRSRFSARVTSTAASPNMSTAKPATSRSCSPMTIASNRWRQKLPRHPTRGTSTSESSRRSSRERTCTKPSVYPGSLIPAVGHASSACSNGGMWCGEWIRHGAPSKWQNSPTPIPFIGQTAPRRSGFSTWDRHPLRRQIVAAENYGELPRIMSCETPSRTKREFAASPVPCFVKTIDGTARFACPVNSGK